MCIHAWGACSYSEPSTCSRESSVSCTRTDSFFFRSFRFSLIALSPRVGALLSGVGMVAGAAAPSAASSPAASSTTAGCDGANDAPRRAPPVTVIGRAEAAGSAEPPSLDRLMGALEGFCERARARGRMSARLCKARRAVGASASGTADEREGRGVWTGWPPPQRLRQPRQPPCVSPCRHLESAAAVADVWKAHGRWWRRPDRAAGDTNSSGSSRGLSER